MIVLLILLSRLKYDIIWMTANFLDVWIVNADAMQVYDGLRILTARPSKADELRVYNAVGMRAREWASDTTRPASR